MINRPAPVQKWMLLCALPLLLCSVQAQTKVLINAFNNSDEVTVNNGNPWGNWFGTAYYQVLWDASDASNNVSSGSMQIQTFFPDSGIGGCCGPQFVAYNQNNGINPPLTGNGGNPSAALATNIEFDVRFDPTSIYTTNSGNWPTIEVGTRGVDFGQHTFATFTVPTNQTGWVHITLPIGASALWTNIPNVYFKMFSTTFNGFLKFYVDNIIFTTAAVPIVPPTMSITKAKPGLRMFTGPSQYNRDQLVAVDTNQSWVGGTYPVTYSFDISDYDVSPPINEFHLFLTPLAFVQGGVINQFTDYSSASNNFRLQITGGAPGTAAVIANLDWKTNIINANPDHIVASITNSTMLGTWTIRFNSATAGTLIMPTGTSTNFSLPSDVAATFANPLAFFIGVQPNPIPSIGNHIEMTKITTTGVASPGVPINSDLTTGIDTNVWSLAATASTAYLVPVTNSSSWWVSSSYPDYGEVLATAPTVSGPWKTPRYYQGYDTNSYFEMTIGPSTWRLLPASALPTVDGLSNSVKSANAFFRTQSPAPAE